MPLFGGLRANSKCAEGTSLLNGLARIDDPTRRRDTLRRAIESLTAATELKPDFGPAWHNLGHAYYYSGRLLVEIANSLEESSESSDASPDSQIGFFRKNAIASYENSLKVLDVAVKLMPNAAEVHNSLGRTLVVLNRDEEASNEFKIASEIDPSNLTARENQNTLGILTKAEAALDELSTLITSFQEQGYAFFNSGQYTDAISMFNEIIRLHPDDPQAYNVRGIAYGRLGQNHDAISDFDKAIELNPDHAVHSNRGLSYFGLGRYQRAIDDFDKTIARAPDDVEAYYMRGRSYHALGQYDRAIEDYDEAVIDLNPNYAWAYYNRGICHHTLGQYERAIEDYDKAIELEGPDFADALTNKQRALRGLKESMDN